jgi:transposase
LGRMGRVHVERDGPEIWIGVVLIKPKSWDRHGLKPWLEAAKKRLHHNVLAIALANKLARIAWSVLARGRAFEASKLQVA